MGGWRCSRCDGENVEGMRFCGWCGVAYDLGAADHADHDEQRLVTALFADISGFTSLADRLEAEELHEVISPVISGLAGIAERYEGYIAKYAGDALLVFFGAPIAHEDDAERALLVALEMHRALPGLVEHLPLEAQHLELHIGVNTGRVISGQFGGDLRSDYSILGDAVNVAQRLESVAPAGAIYIGQSTYDLARERFELEFVGDLTVKGKPEPVAAWRVLGRVTAQSSGVDVGELGASFIGRDRELSVIGDTLDALSSGQGGVVIVTGEPGVGKSRLTEEVRARAEAQGTRWLESRCISYGAGVAYWPYVDLVRRAFSIRVEDDPVQSARVLGEGLAAVDMFEMAPYFCRLLGVPSSPGSADVSTLEPEAFQRGLHVALERWLLGLTRSQPVMLVIEDLHWIDATSVDVTRKLAQLTGRAPFGLYTTSRSDGAAAIDALIGREPDARIVVLEPFGPVDTDSMVEGMLQDAAPALLLDVVRERTAGNPFFVRELVRSLVETGSLARDDDKWVLHPEWDATAVPATIEGVLSARIDLLPRATAEVLQVASVIGRTVDVDLLRLVAEDVPDLTGAMDALVASGFLDRRVIDGVEYLSFHHALVLDVAYSRLVKRQRRDLHRRVAEAAEVIYGSGDDVIDLLAREFYLAKAGAKAVDYLQRAGERAKRLYANEEAILHLSRGIEIANDTPRAASRLPTLLLDLADLEDLTGDYDDAFDLYGQVRDQLDDPRAWRGMATSLRKRGQFSEALELIDEAFASPALAGVDLTPLWLERAWILVAAGRFLEAMEAAQAGLAAAPATRDPFVGQLLLQLARSEEALWHLEDALAHGQQAHHVFENLEDLRLQGTALRYMGSVLTELGRLDEAADAVRHGLELAERTGFVEELGGCLVNLGRVEYKRGRLDAAIACDLRALDAFQGVGHVHGEAVVYANIAEKLRDNGDLDEAVRYCDKALDVGAVIGSTLVLADANRTLASVRLLQGMPAESASRAEASATLFLECGDQVNAGEALDIAADALAQLGDAEGARSMHERARSLVDS